MGWYAGNGRHTGDERGQWQTGGCEVAPESEVDAMAGMPSGRVNGGEMTGEAGAG
jgi:hypothetical protein